MKEIKPCLEMHSDNDDRWESEESRHTNERLRHHLTPIKDLKCRV